MTATPCQASPESCQGQGYATLQAKPSECEGSRSSALLTGRSDYHRRVRQAGGSGKHSTQVHDRPYTCDEVGAHAPGPEGAIETPKLFGVLTSMSLLWCARPWPRRGH